MEWIKKNLPFISEIAIVNFGTPKFSTIERTDEMWLFDDNNNVCRQFFTMANNLAKAKTDLTDFISNNGLLAKEPFTTFNNQFWLCSDLKEEYLKEYC